MKPRAARIQRAPLHERGIVLDLAGEPPVEPAAHQPQRLNQQPRRDRAGRQVRHDHDPGEIPRQGNELEPQDGLDALDLAAEADAAIRVAFGQHEARAPFAAVQAKAHVSGWPGVWFAVRFIAARFRRDPAHGDPATARAFFDRVIAEKGMIAGYHFGFPNVGTISKDGSGYAFEAVKA